MSEAISYSAGGDVSFRHKRVQTLRIPAHVPLLCIKDLAGHIQYFYTVDKPVVLPDWVDYNTHPDVQRFLDLGLIEQFDPRTGVNPDPGRIWECFSIVCGLEDLPPGAGRPKVAEALRGQGFRFSNATISEAVKMFKDTDYAKAAVEKSRAMQ